jgi:hypothetical protein
VVRGDEANCSINLEHAMLDLASKKAELIDFKNSSNFLD